MGKILYNVDCNHNPDHHKEGFEIKMKILFKNVFEIKIQSQTISQIQNPS